MIEISIVGSGCLNCRRLEALCREIVEENNILASISKVTDWRQFTALGIMLTPGLLINGNVVSSGKIPVKATLTHWILNAAKS